MTAGKKTELQIDLVEKVTKQIITLCAGIIVVLVTILGYYLEYFNNQSVSSAWTILFASISFLLSIISGLFVYGTLINSIYGSKNLEELNIYDSPLRYIAIFQWFTFALGIALLTISLYPIL